MSDNDTQVVLVTADARLRATIRGRQPSDVSLKCIAPSELARGRIPSASEWWIDLSTTDGLPALPAARRVYFHSRQRDVPEDLPPGLFIRRPCTSTVAQVLWARVERPSATIPTVGGERPHAWLPHWALAFHELGLRELCRKCVNRLGTRLGYADVSMYLHDHEEGVLTLAETTHKRPIDLAVPVRGQGTKGPRDQGAVGGHLMAAVTRSGKIMATCDAAGQFATHGLRRPTEQHHYADGLCLIAPLSSGGRLWGVLNFSCARRTEVTEVGVPLEPLFALIGRSLRYARAYDRARTQARVDSLTGLYNNRWLTETLTREIRRSQRSDAPLAVIVADLDGLKDVNDRTGHVAGDCLLRHVAGRITAVLRESDSGARVGGDEFVALLPATDLQGARHVARRMLESIRSDPAVFRDVQIPIRVSLGVAQWESDWNPAELIEAADQAMYEAKRQGGDQLVCRSHHVSATVPASYDRQPRVWPTPSATQPQTRAAESVPEVSEPTPQPADSHG